MACYSIPLAAAILHYGMRRKVTKWKHSVHHLWLNLLFAGAAIFGVIDHLWNGELFLIGEYFLWDILLGVVSTVGITIGWVIIVALSQKQPEKISTTT